MISYTVEIFVPDGAEEEKYRKGPETLQFKAADVDKARKQARDLLKARGYHIRALSFATNGKIIAYTGVKQQAIQLGGWRYKKPPTSRPKI